jgi:hypothetical protein
MAILNRESHRRAASDEIPMVDGVVSRLDRIVLGGGWPGAYDGGAVRCELIVGPAVHIRQFTGPAVRTNLGVTPR